MAEIEIKKPFILTIEIIEIDNYLPSFKIQFSHKNEGNNFNFNNEIRFWIECNQWDFFLKQLNENGKNIELVDMDNIIRLKFQIINESYFITINNSIKTMEINNVINIYEYKIEKELFEQIINKINEFPKWW